ncbi:MAG TPA: GNAT family N-acetyltransferase [Paludibacter sp.]
MIEFKLIETTVEFPKTWDKLAENYFQQRKFLTHAEKFNPCRQRYYICFEDGEAVAAAIVYSIRIDILTFVKVKSPLKMNIVGIPCSVSSPGVFGKKAFVEALKTYIYQAEDGLLLFLNLPEKTKDMSHASGYTLPTIVFSNKYVDWNDYVASLRTGYRRRLKQINQNNPDLRLEKKKCSAFTEEMYKQYLEVYNRSNGKLEKLTFDFFRNLPPEFILTVCYEKDTIIGWNLALAHENMYYFFLGGIDYKRNRINNTYLRLLSGLIHDGIERKAEFIELGQTAETPKMRMGGKPETLYMEAYHSNGLMNGLLKLGKPLLEYKRKLENTNALKEELR